jgi:hypothetical protein
MCERAVKPIDRFVVAPGHEDPAVEVVAERRDGFSSCRNRISSGGVAEAGKEHK